ALHVLLASLVGNGRAVEHALEVRDHFVERIRRQKIPEAVTEQIVSGNADPIRKWTIGEAQPVIAVEIEYRQLDAVGDEPEPVLALSRFQLEQLQMIDIRVCREKAAHESVGLAIGVIVDANPDRR